MTETNGSLAERPAAVSYGVVGTPAMVVDEHVVLSGRVPTVAHVQDVLTRTYVS